MATTFAQGWTKQAEAMEALDDLFKAFGVNAGANFVDGVQNYQLAAQSEGREAAIGLAAFQNARDNLVSLIRQPTDKLNPQLSIIARSSAVNSQRRDVAGQLADIYTYMVDNAQAVTSRGFVRGSYTNSGSPVGNGTFKRIWLRADGFPLEVAYPETRTYTCTKDQNLGAQFKGREEFLLKGAPFVDELEWTTSGRGSGLGQFTNVVNADDSLLANPNFSATPTGGDATPSGSVTWNGTTYGNVAGWLTTAALVGDGTDVIVDRTVANIYQEAKLDNGSPAALRFKTSKTIFQPLKGRLSNNIAIDDTLPYYFGLRYKPDGNGQWTGTIAITVGSKTWTVTVAAQTGWNELSIDTHNSSFTQTDAWYENWGQSSSGNNATFQIAVTKTSGATTYLLVSRVMLLPYRPVFCPQTGGVMDYILGMSGATPFMREDAGYVTDTEVGGVILNHWSHRTWGFTFPSRPPASAAGVAVTTALSATAGVVTAGTHLTALAPVTSDGVEGPIGPASNSTNADGTHRVDITGAPAAPPANIALFKIYATKAGTTTPYYYTGSTITAAVTTGFWNVADASLTVQPKTISIAEP